MILLVLGLALYVLALVFTWALCRTAGLSDEAVDRWATGDRFIPPKGW